MSSANPFWGARRIRSELLKLGVDVPNMFQLGLNPKLRRHCLPAPPILVNDTAATSTRAAWSISRRQTERLALPRPSRPF
jgi:hypothetical protein